jgi:hypothetical protein
LRIGNEEFRFDQYLLITIHIQSELSLGTNLCIVHVYQNLGSIHLVPSVHLNTSIEDCAHNLPLWQLETYYDQTYDDKHFQVVSKSWM